MRKALFLGFLAVFVQLAITSIGNAKGPFGNIHIGQWKGGAFTDDNTGAFSRCSASSIYGNGVILVVGQNAENSWLLGFASPSFHLTKGNTVPVDVTFDGQSAARLFATANSDIMATAILPPNVARTFQKSSLMVVNHGQQQCFAIQPDLDRALARHDRQLRQYRQSRRDQQRRRVQCTQGRGGKRRSAE